MGAPGGSNKKLEILVSLIYVYFSAAYRWVFSDYRIVNAVKKVRGQKKALLSLFSKQNSEHKSNLSSYVEVILR